mmetsp:Transcript_7822/g.21781  ORF Transcript_7822/g.21781 Transcript_7822/m.21781 type:complete len:200 (+) Transcript_7822:262-861(+)
MAAQAAQRHGLPTCASAATTHRRPPRSDNCAASSRAEPWRARTSSSSAPRSRSTCAGSASAYTTKRIQLGFRNAPRCRRASPASRESRPPPRPYSAKWAAPRQPTPAGACCAAFRGAACPGARAACCVPCDSIRTTRRSRRSPWRNTSKADCKAQDVRHCHGCSLAPQTLAKPKHPGSLPKRNPSAKSRPQRRPSKHRP